MIGTAIVPGLTRLARWQIASRLIRAPIALPFVNDTVLLARTGMTSATANYYFGLYEAAEMAFVLHSLRSGDLYLDIGANIGCYAVAAAATGADVIAVEPVPETFEDLQRNFRLNDIPFEAHRVGISSGPGELRITCGLGAKNRIADKSTDVPTVAVQVTSIDAMLAGRVPWLIKVDVEGHEPEVLRGAARTLADPRLAAVLLETFDDGVVETMARYGFSPHYYRPLERRLFPVTSFAQNTIFVRDREMVQSRCTAAPRFRLVSGEI